MKRIIGLLPENFRLVVHWMLSVAKGQWKRISFSCLVGVCEVACSLGFVWASKNVVDIATRAHTGNLFYAACITAVFLVVQLGFSSIDMWINGCMPVDTGNILRHRLFRCLLQSRWNELEKYHTGDVLNRIVQDTTEVVRFLTSVFPAVFVTSVQLIASFVFLCALDGSLALILSAVIPIFLLISKLYMGKMKRYTHDIRRSDSHIQSVIQESLQHRVVIKTLERNTQRLGVLEGLQSTLRQQVIGKTRLSLFSRIIMGLGFNFGYLLVFLWGVVRLSTGSISFGTMTAFLQLVGRVQRPALDITRLLPSFITAYTAAERLLELENIPAEEEKNRIILQGRVGVRFDGVTFSYVNEGINTLENVNFNFAPGTATAILGETGVGKTTIARLILALTTPRQGTVMLYNDREQIAVSADTRGNLVYVPQGNTLFSGTIRDNLLMGNPDATIPEMEEALRVAVAGFVFELPDGMNTLLSEQGGGLSEGQAQRISIARALLRSGSVLIFDEATSALDADTERTLIDNLRIRCADKTLIFITHHSYLANVCDNTFRLS